MTQTSHAGDPSNRPLSSKKLSIDSSTLTDVHIGGLAGGDISQAGRDVIKNVTNVYNNVYYGRSDKEDKYLKLFIEQQAASQEKMYQKMRNEIAEQVVILKNQLEAQLTSLPKENQAEMHSLVTQIERLTSHEGTLKNIQNELISCYEAAWWLQKHTEYAANYAANKIFNKGIVSQDPDLIQNGTFEMLEKRFVQDITTYLIWIISYLQSGSAPEANFNKSLVHLDLEGKVYKKAFSFITHDLVNPEASDLSIDAAHMLVSYINRFLIDKESQPDLFLSEA